MSNEIILAKIEQLKEWETILEEAEAEVETLKDELKAVMNEQNTEELVVGTHIIRWTTTLTNRFDTTAFKRKYDELYRAFTKQTTSRRFSIS